MLKSSVIEPALNVRQNARKSCKMPLSKLSWDKPHLVRFGLTKNNSGGHMSLGKRVNWAISTLGLFRYTVTEILQLKYGMVV